MKPKELRVTNKDASNERRSEGEKSESIEQQPAIKITDSALRHIRTVQNYPQTAAANNAMRTCFVALATMYIVSKAFNVNNFSRLKKNSAQIIQIEAL